MPTPRGERLLKTLQRGEPDKRLIAELVDYFAKAEVVLNSEKAPVEEKKALIVRLIPLARAIRDKRVQGIVPDPVISCLIKCDDLVYNSDTGRLITYFKAQQQGRTAK